MADDKVAVAPKTNQALEPAPDYLSKTERKGFEDTLQTDLLIPRLALAQALSPQVTDGDPNRIEGLKPGDLFNSITGQRYGTEVYVQLLRKMPLRAMQFRSVEDGGGVIDPNVPLDDPRLAWGTTGDKKKDKPQATLFRDFIAVILPQREIIALSFKSSGIKVAKALWGLATMRNRSVYAGRYVITTGLELKPKPHWVYKVANAGWVSQQDAILGEEMTDAVATIDATKIERSASSIDDPDDFNPGEYEASLANSSGSVSGM